MTRFRLYCTILCLVPAALFCEPRESWAWGSEAHEIIALLADRLLETGDPPVEKKVAEILAADKSNTWTKTDIAGEAIWPDALREKSPEGRVATSKWHYVKLDPDNPDFNKACFGRPALQAMMPASHGPQDDCIVDKIEQFAKELREPGTSAPERLMDVQFLLNLVGDIHDPLFAIERNDQSGRCVAVLPPGSKTPVRTQRLLGGRLGRGGGGEEPGQGRRADRRQTDRSRYSQMVWWHPGGMGAGIDTNSRNRWYTACRPKQAIISPFQCGRGKRMLAGRSRYTGLMRGIATAPLLRSRSSWRRQVSVLPLC